MSYFTQVVIFYVINIYIFHTIYIIETTAFKKTWISTYSVKPLLKKNFGKILFNLKCLLLFLQACYTTRQQSFRLMALDS